MPLYRFVMGNVLNNMILIVLTVGLQRCGRPLVASIRDNALVSGYARELAGLLGMDVEEVRAEVMRAAAKAGRRPAMGRPMTADSQPAAAPEASPALPLLPNPHDRLLATERQTAKLLIQNRICSQTPGMASPQPTLRTPRTPLSSPPSKRQVLSWAAPEWLQT